MSLNSREVSTASRPLVSIIIPTFNSMTGTKNIDATLQSVMAQTYRNIETLVIDNFSKDTTYEACRNFPVRFFQLNSKRSEARNLGISRMHGDYALFVDSDCILEPKVVEECINECIHCRADCVIVPVKFVSKSRLRIDCTQMRNIELRAEMGIQSTILFYSRKLIQNIRFPDSVELGEDIVFSSIVMKRKPNVSRTSSMIYHAEDGTIASLVLRSWNYGRKFPSTISRIGSAESTRLILDISSLNLARLGRIVSTISDSPRTVFSFLLYSLLKHSSFAMSYFLSLLERPGKNSEEPVHTHARIAP